MKKLLMVPLAGMALVSDAASPALTDVGVQQNSSRLVTITYNVDQDCIVTVDVLTNGVSIGEANFTNMTGAVNKEVPAGQNVICWQPRDSWADRRVAAGEMSVNVKAWPLCAPPPYMVVDLDQTGEGYLQDGVFVHYFASTNAFPGGFGNRVYKTTTVVMRHIPAAGVRWRMGISANDIEQMGDNANDYLKSELSRYVTLTNDYWMGIYPLTQGQSKYLSKNGDVYVGTAFSDWEGLDRDLYPFENRTYEEFRGQVEYSVNWPQTGSKVGGYLQQLRNRTNGMKFDLPTDAQWEFACRAGESGMMYDGSSIYENGKRVDNAIEKIWKLGWIYYSRDITGTSSEQLTRTKPVGLRAPNNWGLYDMIGNVSEWCLDWYSDPAGNDVVDPRGPEATSGQRVYRGGSYATSFATARSSFRKGLTSTTCAGNYGFRLAITIP